MEKGKEARWSRRWQSRGSGPTSSPWWWRRGSGPTFSPWWWRRPPHSLALEEVGRRTPMRRCEVEERISITELCCVWHSFYTLKKEKWPFMNLAAEDEKRIWTLRLLWQASSCWPLNFADEDEKRFWTQYLNTLIPFLVLIDWMRMRKILNPIF